jgi:DNA-binding SARP family transcriptional activator
VTAAGLVELRLLGRFAALRDGVEIPPAAFAGRKVRTVVKVLASRQGRFVSNDVLAEAVWPGRPPADPVANLQVLVNRARRALGDGALIVTGQGGYTLAPGPACRVDAEQFRAALSHQPSTSETLREALSWWQGDPLPEEAYDEWAADFRAELFRGRQQALERAAALALDEGDPESAVDLARRAVDAEPLRENATVLLMRALVAAGDGAAALLAYDDLRRALADELGVDPSAEAAELHRRLLGSLPAPVASAPARRARGFTELAFVGREHEVALVTDALTDAGDGVVVVTVSGASGAGKSRLLDHVARDVPMIRARAYLPERSEPWALLRTVLREVVAQDIGYVDRLPAPMAAALAWLLPELEAADAVVADPESRRSLLQEAALRLLELTGVVVALDDVQWCDPSSLGAIEAALARSTGLRMVLAFRPDEAPESELATFLRGRAVTLRVDLGPLSGEALGDLIADAGVVEALCAHTDRTPMVVTEVLRALAAEGLMVASSDGRWQPTAESESPDRAATLAREGQRRAIAARVAGQAEPERTLLGLLALVARETTVATLAEARRSTETEVLDTLARLFRAGLVRLGEQGWAASHDMVTDVVVAGLDVADRSRLHADLARALRSEGDPLVLAHHLREAGDASAAAEAYAVAAQRALDTFAPEEATQLADAGLDVASPDAVADTVRALLHEVRGRARQRLGDLRGGRDDLRTALGLHAAGPARARILAQLAMLASGAEDIVRAAQLAELAVVEAGDDEPVRARALEVASVLDMNNARDERAAERAAEALTLYERLGDAGGMARVIDARAMAQFLGGDVAGGEAALRLAADLFEDSGDLVHVVTPRSTSGHALVLAGSASQGLDQATAALETARTLGHPEGQAYALWHRAEALTALGRSDEAAADATEALTIATRIGHRGWSATAQRAVGLAAQQRGDLDAALDAFRASLDLSEHLGLFASWAAARSALVLVALGRPADAVPLVERALGEGPPLGHYEARWAQAEVAAALGDPDAAGLARRALDLMAAGGVRQGWERLEAMAPAS